MKIKSINEYEAALRFGFSPKLLRWFTQHPVIDESLLRFTEKSGLYYFKTSDLERFDKKLSGRWPMPLKGTRPRIPIGIKNEIKEEAQYCCPICHRNQGEVAHIVAVATSYCNHPENLIFLCPNHHTEYDLGYRSKNIDKDEVLQFKNSLRLFRRHIWVLNGKIIRTYLGALHSAVTIIEVQKKLSKIIPDDEFNHLLEKISSESLRIGGSAVHKVPLQKLKKEIKKFAVGNNELACPLCHGNGSTTIFDPCPVCYGNGLVDRKSVGIDLNEYEPVECRLCEGNGQYEGSDCPACGGGGETSKSFSENHDWSKYDMVDCRLCEGSGKYNGDQCKPCDGNRMVSREFSENHNWNQYEAIPCRLCNGKGRFHGESCPPCEGTGSVTEGFLEAHEWSQYDLVKCNLCKGKGSWKGDECPACDGLRKISKGFSDNHDWSRYDLVKCKLCNGSGDRNGNDCPVCDGIGKIPKGNFEEIDWSQF